MNFAKVGEASAFGFTPPFLFGMPKFDFVACLTMIIVLLITAVESTGSTIATGEIVGKRVKASDIGNVLRADGVATTIGGIFNSFPYTASPRTSAWCASPGSRAAGCWPPRA